MSFLVSLIKGLNSSYEDQYSAHIIEKLPQKGVRAEKPLRDLKDCIITALYHIQNTEQYPNALRDFFDPEVKSFKLSGHSCAFNDENADDSFLIWRFGHEVLCGAHKLGKDGLVHWKGVTKSKMTYDGQWHISSVIETGTSTEVAEHVCFENGIRVDNSAPREDLDEDVPKIFGHFLLCCEPWIADDDNDYSVEVDGEVKSWYGVSHSDR